jgi:hypothetical protein
VDRAIANESELQQHLATLLEAEIVRTSVVKLDVVNDSTLVNVRYRVR